MLNAAESAKSSFDLPPKWLLNSSASCNATVSILLSVPSEYNYDLCNLIYAPSRFKSPIYQNYYVFQYQTTYAQLSRACVHCGDNIPISLIVEFYLLISKFPGYIGEFEIIDDHRSGKIVIQLNGRLNKCGVISPRYNIQHSQIESWVNLLLPARGF